MLLSFDVCWLNKSHTGESVSPLRRNWAKEKECLKTTYL